MLLQIYTPLGPAMPWAFAVHVSSNPAGVSLVAGPAAQQWHEA